MRANACGSGDGTPRRTATDAMAQGGKHTSGHPRNRGVVMGGRPIADNLASIATLASRGGHLGEESTDRWAPSVSDGGVIMGWQASSHAEMGRGHCWADCRENGPQRYFEFESFFN
jgi:hypothetical protein